MSAKPALTSLAAAAVAAAFGTVASEAVAGSSLNILRSWPTTREAGRILDQYHVSVEKAAAGEIKLSQARPDVVPPLEQLSPVSAGVFDMLFSHGAYHAASNAKAFDKLPKKLQTILVEEGKKVEYWSIAWFDKYITEEEAELKGKGVIYHEYPEKFRPHVRKWFNEGVLDLVKKYSKADGAKFVEMARAANMVAE